MVTTSEAIPAGVSGYLFSREQTDRFVESLLEEYPVYGPVKKNGEVVFSDLESASDLLWDYGPTILPPKKYIHRPMETLFSFHEGGESVREEFSPTKQVLIGVHPCDMHSISILDRVFSCEDQDPYYTEQRKNTILIALTCRKPEETCFCSSMGTGPDLKEGFDILVTPLEDEFLLESGSAEGDRLLNRCQQGDPLCEATLNEKLRAKDRQLQRTVSEMAEAIDTRDLEGLLETAVDHPLWQELKEECLACGSCTVVCPTCFCFVIADKLNLDLKSGERQRVWDSCMLLGFAQAALGVNFRSERAARIRQRIYHKLYSFPLQFGTLGCVGCGRCVKACIKGIDPRTIIRDLRGD